MASRVPRSLALFSFCLAAACGGGSSGGGDGDAGPGSDAVVPLCPDRDGDGLCDDDEVTNGTDPDNPDSDGDGISDGGEITGGTDPNNPDSDGDGVLDGDEIDLGTDPTMDDSACADLENQATLVKQPVDVILVIDTSSSMAGEIDQVRANVNTNLGQVLGAADIDYRIILLGDHPGMTDTKLQICISTPLSGDDCSCANGHCTGAPTTGPAMTDDFKQYSVLIDSHDALQRIIQDYATADEFGNPGWGSYLREGAQKAFLLITDDSAFGSDGENAGEPNTFTEFDTQLLALSPAQFGTAAARNYVFHSILGMAANSPATLPWQPADPVQASTCGSGADGPGTLYQDISKQTGGLRFPLCDNDNFNVIFQAVADNVVEGSSLGCSFTPTPSNPETTLDFDHMVVYYTAGGAGAPTKLTRVADLGACVADAYYEAAGDVTLCPTTCEVVQADPDGELSVHVACTTPEIR